LGLHNGGHVPTLIPSSTGPALDKGDPALANTLDANNVLLVNTPEPGAAQIPGSAWVTQENKVLTVHSDDTSHQIALQLKSGDSTKLDILVAGSVLNTATINHVASIVVQLGAGNDKLTINNANGGVISAFSSITFNGGSGTNTLVGPDSGGTFLLTGANAGT